MLATTNPGGLERLLAATAAGDTIAFRALYDAAAAKLYGIALRICREPALAQDVLQETFVKVWTGSRSFAPEAGGAMAWLAAIARNAAIDAMRRRKDVPLGMDEEGRALIDRFELAAEGVDLNEVRALKGCLDGLEPPQRECILLAYCGGYSREELASRFDRPVGTIKTWLHRGLASLKTCLDG